MLHEDGNCGTSHQGAKVVPDFGDVRIQANGARVGIQSVTVLVDLIVKDANGAPKGWIAPISIDGLLVRLIRFGILLL